MSLYPSSARAFGQLPDGRTLGAGIGHDRKGQAMHRQVPPAILSGAVGEVGEQNDVGGLVMVGILLLLAAARLAHLAVLSGGGSPPDPP